MDLKIIKYKNIYLGISIVLVLLSVLMLITRGLNYGIDYTGGTVLQINTDSEFSLTDVQDKVLSDSRVEELNLGTTSTQLFNPGDGSKGVLIRTRFLEDVEEDVVLDVFEEKIGAIDREQLQVQKVGPTIGKELLKNALMALIIAAALMLLYISFRFKFKSGVAAVVALTQDVLIVLGFFALTQKEIDGPFLAAILTLVGYSINDTIVIFDKIRENLRLRRGKESFNDIVSKSVNQNIGRTVKTSVTTLLAVLALLIFGGESIRNFTVAITLGVVVGTYSSMFVASLIWASWESAIEKK